MTRPSCVLVLLASLAPAATGQDGAGLPVDSVVEVEVRGRSGAADVASASWTLVTRFFDRIDVVQGDRPARVLRQVVGGPRLELTLLDPGAPAGQGWRVIGPDGEVPPRPGAFVHEAITWVRARPGEGVLAAPADLFDPCAPEPVPASRVWPDLPACVQALVGPIWGPVQGGRWRTTVKHPPAPALVEVVVSATIDALTARRDADGSPAAERSTCELLVRVSRASALPAPGPTPADRGPSGGVRPIR